MILNNGARYTKIFEHFETGRGRELTQCASSWPRREAQVNVKDPVLIPHEYYCRSSAA